MAYGARLESVLGATPRGFESRILRHHNSTHLPSAFSESGWVARTVWGMTDHESPQPQPGAAAPRRRTGSGGGSNPPVKKTPVGKMILITLVGMAVLFGVGYGIGQFFQSDSSATSADGEAEPDACVTVNVTPTPLPPDQIQVTVLNSSAPAGSAGNAAEVLGGSGFQIASVGNGSTDVTTAPAVIRYGPTSAEAAKTLNAYLAGAVEMQESPDVVGLELILVGPFEGVVDAGTAQAELTVPIPTVSGPGCPQLDPAAPADPNAVPQPTPAAA